MYSGKARESFAAALGHHYRQARVLDKALQYYLQAGDSATKIYAYEQARISYAACVELDLPTMLARKDKVVKELTGGKQTPTTTKPNTVPDFPIALRP